MPIEKVNIPAFEGVNVNLRPDLIKDSQASEMINLRFNRMGALVSRNGSIAYNIPDSISAQPAGLNNKGCVAIGEFVITAIDNDSQGSQGYGTDRFMVYALRQSTIDSSDTELPTRHTMQYIMCPLTGPFKNRLQQTTYSKAFIFKENASGASVPVQLVAPRRELENLDIWQSDIGELYDQNWIEHYGKMNQYGNVLVISDRTNGDMLLIDEYNEAEPGTTGKHKFRLQENCKAPFDIDIVDLDFGLDEEGFNTKGVKNGLGLYQFYLPRKNALINRDYFSDFWSGSDADVLGRLTSTLGVYTHNSSGVIELSRNGTFITAGVCAENGEAEDMQSIPIGIGVNQDNQYVFSDLDEAVQIDDLLGELTFINPQSSDKLEQAADIYVWDDLEMTYYPCSGKDLESTYLRGKDREFTKTAPLLPKIQKLKTKLGMEQDVPLGVWRYRFVWDMGNGEYSNPSSEMSIPDILWSTLTDDALESALLANDRSYERPAKQRQADAITQPRSSVNEQVNTDLITAAPIVFDSGYNLTTYGEQFKKIKDKLYLGTNHRFAMLVGDGVPAMNHALRAELGVIATSKFGSGGNKVDCKGFVLEGAASFSDGIQRYKYPLSVPIFRGNAQETYNSVFADNGEYRVAWQNRPEYVTSYQPNVPSWQIVLWGKSIAGAITNNTYDTVPIDILKRKEPGIFFNVVPLESAFEIDQNNNPEPVSGHSGNTLSSYRIATQFRAVKSESERLSNMASNLPAQVSSRLLLQGIPELVLADPTLPGTITNATAASDQGGTELLHHDTKRRFREMDEYPVSPGNFWSWNGHNLLNDHCGGYYGQTATIYHPNNITSTHRVVYNTNVTVAIHGEGERLTIPEQLTSYFPSSLLFGAPRVKLKIKAGHIPARAKRLMIFRTLASHDNNWASDKFGLVKSIKVPRNIETKDIEDVEFLDDIKDKDLDFGLQLDEFQGLTHPLKSRFNLPLNETMYYANFMETYQPPAPRSGVEVVNGGSIDYYANNSTTNSHTTYSQNVMWTRLSSDTFTAPLSRRLLYCLLNKDASGVYSKPAIVSINTEPIDVGAKQAICLVNAPQPSGIADEVEVWRGTEVGSSQFRWELVGTIAKDMEGIFLDDNKEPISQWEGAIDEDTGIISVPADEVENPSGLRNSEPYQPNNTRLESLYSVRSGDGDQITGIEQLYGNLVVFKERSIHRIAVQSSNPPYSRTDEISNRIGCIAPNTILSHNNDIYFLSWSGFYRFNNNVLQKADGDFFAELERKINNFQSTNDTYGQPRNPAVRDASCAYNPVYNEIYLNVPVYKHEEPIAPDIEAMYGSRKMRGHIYVIQLESGLVTKFHYEQDGSPEDRTQGRLYHTNSLGELRAAQILSDNLQTRPALICIDAPTEVATDSTSDYSYVGTEWKFGGESVNTLWRSKHFTLNDKSIVKRVVKVLGNVRKGEYIRISGGAQNEAYNTYNHAESRWWEYEFDGAGELTAVPPRTSSAPGNDDSKHPERGERVAFQIETQGETMIDSFAFYWRPVNQYMR